MLLKNKKNSPAQGRAKKKYLDWETLVYGNFYVTHFHG